MSLKLKIMDILTTFPIETASISRYGNGLKNADHIADKILAAIEADKKGNLTDSFMDMMEKEYDTRFVDV